MAASVVVDGAAPVNAACSGLHPTVTSPQILKPRTRRQCTVRGIPPSTCTKAWREKKDLAGRILKFEGALCRQGRGNVESWNKFLGPRWSPSCPGCFVGRLSFCAPINAPLDQEQYIQWKISQEQENSVIYSLCPVPWPCQIRLGNQPQLSL